MAQTATAQKTQPKQPHASGGALRSQRRRRGWSDARRAKQAARIRIWAPWAKSTGPKTIAGKQKSAQNAYRHGNRARDMRLMRQAFRAYSRFLRNANALITLKRRGATNELLKPLVQRVGLKGLIATAQLQHALFYAEIMQKP